MWAALGYGRAVEGYAEPGRVGLRDLGHSSFASAGLQCLTHVESLSAYFRRGKHLGCGESHYVALPGYGGEIAKAFGELQVRLWEGGEAVQDARRLHLKLASLQPKLFDQCASQDVQEFLIFLLEALHADLHKAPALPLPSEDLQEALVSGRHRLSEEDEEELMGAMAWAQCSSQGRTFVTDLMQGQLRTSLTCTECGHCTQCFEPFLHLSLPVTASTESLSGAFEELLREELSMCGQWTCPACGSKADALKRVELWRLPPVLVLHLRRISFDHRTLQFRKVECAMTSPLKLDLSRFCSSRKRGRRLYDITCVANQVGPHSCGHFSAVCRVGDADSGDWFVFDNEHVKPLPPGQPVLSREASVVVLESCPQSNGRGARLIRSHTEFEESVRPPQTEPLLERLEAYLEEQRVQEACALHRENSTPSVTSCVGDDPPEVFAQHPAGDQLHVVLLEGWLCRCVPGSGEDWAWQWAVLIPGALCFYSDSTRCERLGEIRLTPAVTIDVDDEPCAATGDSELYVFMLSCVGNGALKPGMRPPRALQKGASFMEDCSLATDTWEKLNAWTQAIRHVATGDMSSRGGVCCTVS